MTDVALTDPNLVGRETGRPRAHRARRIGGTLVVLAGLAATIGFVAERHWKGAAPPAAAPPPPHVTVAMPLQETIAATTSFLGQFSAVNSVALRAQVGGTLSEIGFRDGQIVHKGDLLFVIDPRPFQIRLDQAVAQFQTAAAKKALTEAELWRSQELRRTSFGTVENVDQRAADQRGAEAAVETAKAAIRDAQLDLEFARLTAPFTGRIGAHLVSVGNLVSGSRGGAGATTLLASIVSLDPIHLDFDMSEADYLAYQHSHTGTAPQDDVAISLAGDGRFDRHGTLDFIDNAVDRSSGTIHARATVPNQDLAITPGQFTRLRLALGRPAPVLLVPAAAVVPDQARQIVMTVGPDDTVVPKPVAAGDLYRGLRIISGGLEPGDRVIIDGLVRARPGAKVTPAPGTITPITDGEHG